MSIFSALSPSSKSIQKEYVDKRLRHIKTDGRAQADAVQKVIVEFQRKKNIDPNRVPWTKTYTDLMVALCTADLTINLDAGDWFLPDSGKDNTYKTYTQTYERALQPGGGMLLKDDEHNKAGLRAMADDMTTLPDEWANAHPWSQRKRLYKAMNASGANLGMKNAFKHPDDDPLQTQKSLTLKGDGKAGLDTTNKHFKPKAKEVFAALNYGRRLHGANTSYGFSYIVLNPELKKRALYYPADTFYIAPKGTKTQASYDTLGGLVQHASPLLIDDLWKYASGAVSAADTHDGMLMVEAHIFKRVKIATDVRKLVLARPRKAAKTKFDDATWAEVKKKAHEWAKRNGGIVVHELD